MEEQNIQNEQTEHKLNPILNLTGRGHFFVYNFARLRDWRVVQMADAQGVIREGIFLPFLQNGITVHDRRDKIIQSLYPDVNTASKLGVKTYSPCISRVAHEKLVEQGLLLPVIRRGQSRVWASVCVILVFAVKRSKKILLYEKKRSCDA